LFFVWYPLTLVMTLSWYSENWTLCNSINDMVKGTFLTWFFGRNCKCYKHESYIFETSVKSWENVFFTVNEYWIRTNIFKLLWNRRNVILVEFEVKFENLKIGKNDATNILNTLDCRSSNADSEYVKMSK
jgi:hypothetical protein